MSTSTRFFGAVALCLLLGGCSYEPQFEQLSCTVDQDCAPGARCEAKVCVAAPDNADVDRPDVGSPDIGPQPDDSIPLIPARVEVEPALAEVSVGQTLSLVATVFDASANVLEDLDVTWSSSDDAIATVDQTGTVTAVALGSVQVRATLDDLFGAAEITVVAPAASVVVDPDMLTLGQGVSAQLTATALDANGEEVPDREAIWTSSAPDTVEVDEDGMITALVVGTATVTAEIDGLSASASITVEDNPVTNITIQPDEPVIAVQQIQTFEAVLTDDNGDIVDPRNRTISWSLSNMSVATLISGSEASARRVHGMRPGNVTLAVEVDNGATTVNTVHEIEVRLLLEQVSAGELHTCGVTPDRIAMCWGSNADGRLGTGGSASDQGTPTIVQGSALFREVHAGRALTCGLGLNGAVSCWGASGLTGASDGSSSDVPRPIDGGRTYAALAVGREHACAIDAAAGDVWCWGRGGDGQLGHSDTNDANAPVQVQFTPAGKPVALALGHNHSCVLTDTPQVWCWGRGEAGALGHGSDGDSDVPVAVSSALTFESIAAGRQFTCARTDTDEVHCWGTNASGQLGIGDLGVGSQNTPAMLSGVSMSAIALGEDHGCGLDASNGEVKCWGTPANFRLGNDNDTVQVAAPQATSGSMLGAAITAGDQHSCAIDLDSKPYCWGSNGSGRGGTNASDPLQVPSLVWSAP